jgi:NADH-quinone oxidoreductase subunit G
VLVSEATLTSLGVPVGAAVELSTDRGAAVLAVGVADLDDDVVWAPSSSGGVNVSRDLGAGSGSMVRLSRVQAAAPATQEAM